LPPQPHQLEQDFDFVEDNINSCLGGLLSRYAVSFSSTPGHHALSQSTVCGDDPINLASVHAMTLTDYLADARWPV